jgi:hypothetical protein
MRLSVSLGYQDAALVILDGGSGDVDDLRRHGGLGFFP